MKTETDDKKRWKKGGRRITLKFDGDCKDCGAFLPAGSTARWYGRGRLYGLSCHGIPEAKVTPEQAGIPSPGGFKGFDGLFEPEPAPEPKAPEPTAGKVYDCTKNPFEKTAPEPKPRSSGRSGSIQEGFLNFG